MMQILPNTRFVILLCALCILSAYRRETIVNGSCKMLNSYIVVNDSLPKNRQSLLLCNTNSIINENDHLLKGNAYICKVCKEKDESNEWKWVLPYPDQCGCTKIIMGGINTWTPIRPFKPVYVDSPLLSDETIAIRKHYGVHCVEESVSEASTSTVATANIDSSSARDVTTNTGAISCTEASTDCNIYESSTNDAQTNAQAATDIPNDSSVETPATTTKNVKDVTTYDVSTSKQASTDAQDFTSVGPPSTTSKEPSTTIKDKTTHGASASTRSASLSTLSDACDSGWELFIDHCYFFNHDAQVTFNDSENECKDMDANLVSIHNQAEQDFVAEKTKFSEPSHLWWSYWIGFNDLEAENQFVWTDGSESNYTFWNPSEPNDSLFPQAEDCTAMAQKHGDTWVDVGCNTLFAYVCKK